MQLTTLTVDSPLGRWTQCKWRPPQLADVVEHMWHFDGRMMLPRKRSFPGGYIELIFHLGPRFRAVDRNGMTLDAFPLACLTGMQTGPLVIEAPSESCCVLGVRLRPVGAYALLARPVVESTGLTVDLSDLAGRNAVELTEQCEGMRSVEERFSRVAAWIAARLARSPGATAEIAWAAACLERSRGTVPVTSLRDRTGLARARFASTFREQVGLTPKRYGRVLRFRHALTLLQAGGRLSDVALSAGYYDQPHMNADFREFAGMTPAAFATAACYPNSPSLPEPAAPPG